MKKFTIIISIIALSIACIYGCKNKNEKSDAQNSAKNAHSISIAKILTHPALDATEKGIEDELKAQGLNVKIEKANANADMSIVNVIAEKFKGEKNDLVVGIGTPVAVALKNTISDRPIVFAAITDPIAVNLVSSLDKGGKNITGVSDAIDTEKQLSDFRTIVPFKKLGLIYTSSEENSVVMKNTTEAVCKKLGIELVPVSITTRADVGTAAASMLDRVDAFYVITDNNLVSALNSLTSVARAAKIPVFSADPSSTQEFGGVLYTSGADYYKGGRMAGQIIAEILNGKSTEEIPVKFMKNADETMTIVDKAVVKELGVKIPENLVSDTTIYLNDDK